MNERSIFLSALEMTPPAERAAYLDQACAGDVALRQRVEALLKAHEQPSGVVDALAGVSERTPTIVPGGADSQSEEAVDSDVLKILGPSASPDCLGVIGPYEVMEVIGRGGMGVVFRARDPRLQRIVAIKVLAPEIASNKAAKKRFEREAQAAAAVSNDHIVTIHAVDEHNGLPFLVMECIVGRTLQKKVEESGPLELKEILRIGMQAALGLAAAHQQGLVHRDIKPANILLQNGIQRVKITDFGLARAVDDVGMTHSGQIAGTPLYMSPEQAEGRRVDHLSDLFSLGSVLYTMCTGRPAFRAPSTVAVLKRIVDDTPRPIRDVNPDLPSWLVDIVNKLLSKEKSGRFPAATEVADVLGRHLSRLQEPKSSATAVKKPSNPETPGSTPGEQGRKSRPRSSSTTRISSGLKPKHDQRPELASRRQGGITGHRPTWWGRMRNASAMAWMVGAVLVPGVIALLVMMAQLLNRDQLQVRIELDDSLRQQDVTVILDEMSYAARDLGPSIRIKPGVHRLEIHRGAEQFKSEQFTISQNEKPLFRLMVENGQLSVVRADPGTVPRPLAEVSPSAPAAAATSKDQLAFKSPEFQKWAQDVAAMPIGKQVDAVSKKLVELNPAFDGQVTPTFQDNSVVGLRFVVTDVKDISPVRALPALRSLQCPGQATKSDLRDLSPLTGTMLTELDLQGTSVSDLSPLKGLNLKVLGCGYTPVSDLSPLKGMPLEELNCWHSPVSDFSPLNPKTLKSLAFNRTGVPDLKALNGFKLKSVAFLAMNISDLTPLQGMPLESLDCAINPVTDLSPLAGMKLKYLNCGGTLISSLAPLKDSELTSLLCADTQISDLAPLRGKKLTTLYCGNTKVTDLSPLAGMPLVELYCKGAQVTDHSPLGGMPLLRLELDFNADRDTELLRSLKSLVAVNGKPVAEFWKDFEKR